MFHTSGSAKDHDMLWISSAYPRRHRSRGIHQSFHRQWMTSLITPKDRYRMKTSLIDDASSWMPHIHICLCKEHGTWCGRHTPCVSIPNCYHSSHRGDVGIAQIWYVQTPGTNVGSAGHNCFHIYAVEPRPHNADEHNQDKSPHETQNKPAMTAPLIFYLGNIATELQPDSSGKWLVTVRTK